MKFLSAKTVSAPTHLGAAASRIEKRIDEKLNPHSAYMIGFTRVLGNMGGAAVFGLVAAAILCRMRPTSLPMSGSRTRSRPRRHSSAGVALGAITWFCALSYLVSRRGYGRLNEQTLVADAALFGFLPARAWYYTMAGTSPGNWPTWPDIEFEEIITFLPRAASGLISPRLWH